MEDVDVPFWIEAGSASGKRNRTKAFSDHSTLCKNTFSARLDTDFIVHAKPDAEGTTMEWEELILTDEVYIDALSADIKTDDVIYVQANEEERPNKSDNDDEAEDPEPQPFADCWVAHVLEIRSLNSSSSVFGPTTDSDFVYIRVNWLYRPGDLKPHQRGPHLAVGEVVPSSCMQIIDARTVAGKVATLKHLDEHDFASLSGGYDELVWRQTLEYFKTPPTLSKLRNICVCEAPANPDFGPLVCNAFGGCSFLMHPGCIADYIICRLYREHVLRERVEHLGSGKSTPVRPPSVMVKTARKYFDLDLTSTAVDQNKSGPLFAKVLRLRETKGEGRDELKKVFDQPVHCLRCFKQLAQQTGHALLDPKEGVR